MAFPELLGEDLYRTNYDLQFNNFNDNSPNHPGLVGDTMPDLFDTKSDPDKHVYALEIAGMPWCLYTVVFSTPRRPTPWDGLGLWTTQGFDAARIKNHLEASDPGAYKTTAQWLSSTKTVASRTFNGTFTVVTLSAGAFDPTLWDIFSAYSLTTAGVNHSTHPNHLGWLQKTDGSYAFTIERQVKTDFQAATPKVYIATDVTAQIQPGDSLNLFWLSGSLVPGFDTVGAGRISDNATTSLCAMADEVGQGLANPTAGWWKTFVDLFITDCRPWSSGLMTIQTRLHPVCWGNHGGHVPGDNSQLLAWRRCLKYMRSRIADEEFQIHEEDGPYDWAIGLLDGHTRVTRRLDVVTAVGSWGVSPFFQVAWGDYYRMGSSQGAFEGHLTNFQGQATYDAFFEGPPKLAYREAVAGDFMLGYIPAFGVSPNPAHTFGGLNPAGLTARTPLYHPTHGIANLTSMASLWARLVRFGIEYDMANCFGRRLRSMHRVGTSTIPYHPISTGYGHEEFHTIGVDELGTTRAPIMHSVILDHDNRRRLLALFVNDGDVAVQDSYVFDPAKYPELLPAGSGGFFVTRTLINPSSVVRTAMPTLQGAATIDVALEPAEVVVYEITFPTALDSISTSPPSTSRRSIRNAIVARLMGATVAGSRVFSNRVDAWEESVELPGICVYVQGERAQLSGEAPREYQRDVDVIVQAIVADIPRGSGDDALATIVEQIRARLLLDEPAGGTAARSWYTGLSIEQDQHGKRRLLSSTIRVTCRYYTMVDEGASASVDLDRLHADWSIAGGAEIVAVDEVRPTSG
jgi:hypothetical protein